jgi:alanine racemase
MDNPKAVINLNNIKHNIQQIKLAAPNAKILALIKADGYGHGAIKIAQCLDSDNNISAYGVSRYSEALALHQAGIAKPILLMEGVIDQDQLSKAIDLGFWLVVQNFYQLNLIAEINKSCTIWLKFDTGMHRLGFLISEVDEVINFLENNNKINKNLVVISHLACADENNNLNNIQLENFDCLIKKFKTFNLKTNNKLDLQFSLANSAAIFNGLFRQKDYYFDWVRPGISLYGSSPLLNKTSADLKLKPSMTMLSKVITVKNIDAGDTVGYGAAWQAKQKTLIAIVAVGYADFYPRIVQNTAVVWIKNKKCPIIGRVSMDMLAIDCSTFNINEITIGEQVELWGGNITIDEVAKSCNTISYELYTRITSRVEKVYVYEKQITNSNL